MRGLACAAVVATVAALPALAHAEVPLGAPERFGLGLQAGLLDAPRGHVGAPLQGDESGFHMPLAIVVRWRTSDRMAFGAGVGLPTSSVGVSWWLSHELFARLVTSPRAVVALDLYENAGLQFGFAGPDEYARHENEFVGYAYVYSGPLAFALRLPVGLRASWLGGVFDTYVESVPMLKITPHAEGLFDLALGIRFRL